MYIWKKMKGIGAVFFQNDCNVQNYIQRRKYTAEDREKEQDISVNILTSRADPCNTEPPCATQCSCLFVALLKPRQCLVVTSL
jgi:hypothetical protein